MIIFDLKVTSQDKVKYYGEISVPIDNKKKYAIVIGVQEK